MPNEAEKPVVIKPVSVPTQVRAASIPPSALKPLPVPPTTSVSGDKLPMFRFAKLWGVCEVLKFKDGSEFTFRLIRRNNGSGYNPTSSVETQDPTLAANLRAASKENSSIREIGK